MRIAVLGIALLVVARSAAATAYDDFSNGMNANNRGAPRAAIASFTAALNAGDLAPAHLPSAHIGRSNAYLNVGQCADAERDAQAAVALKPDLVMARVLLADAHRCLGELDKVLADYRSAISLRPSARVFEASAYTAWQLGRFADAAETEKGLVAFVSSATFRHSFGGRMEDRPANSDSILDYAAHYAVYAERAGTLDRDKLTEWSRVGTEYYWPTPVLAFFSGKISSEVLLKKAADSQKVGRPSYAVCQADFYLGEWQLAHNDAAEAKRLLQKAVAECPHERGEYEAAQFELNRQK